VLGKKMPLRMSMISMSGAARMKRYMDIGLSNWRTTNGMTIQHKLNALHVFCRLRDMGISAKAAQRLIRLYEKMVRHFLYHS
jgi:hypothetical protein